MTAANLRIGAYVVLGLCGLYLIRTLWTPSPEAEITNHNKALLKLGARVQATADSLHRLESLNAAQARAFRFVQSTALAQIESLHTMLSMGSAQDSVAILPVLVHRLEVAGAACDSAFAAESLSLGSCDERASLLQVRIDTLTSALGRQIQVSQCRVLVLRCPTRTQAFIVGALGGFLGGYVLHP